MSKKLLSFVIAIAMVMSLFTVAFAVPAAAQALGNTVYLKTTVTSTPYIHYWYGSEGSEWPGEAMTPLGNDVFAYELPCSISEIGGIIFKKDGGGGDESKLTADLRNITGNYYDLSIGKWLIYETSEVHENSSDTDANTDTDTDISSHEITFYFRPGSDDFAANHTILFYIWDATNWTFASKNGWSDDNVWGSKKRLSGTPVDVNGETLVQSYTVDVDPTHEVYVIVHDLTTGSQTCDCVLTPSANGKVLSLTGRMLELPVDRSCFTAEADFEGVPDCGSHKVLTSTCHVVGKAVAPNEDPAKMFVERINAFYLNSNYGTQSYWTYYNVHAAIAEYDGLTDYDVWNSYVDTYGYDSSVYDLLFNITEKPDEPYTDTDTETDTDNDETYTYYFLAPDNYFKKSAGASNSSVGVYWWQPYEVSAWPGIKITPAFDVGKNVFKVEGVSSDTATIIFNAFVDPGSPADPNLLAVAHQSVNINTEGYAYGECPYDENVITDNFNDWIFVYNCNSSDNNYFSGAETTGGAWFKLDDYKNYGEYYGSYTFKTETGDEPYTDTDYYIPDTDTDDIYYGGTPYIQVENEPYRMMYDYFYNDNGQKLYYVDVYMDSINNYYDVMLYTGNGRNMWADYGTLRYAGTYRLVYNSDTNETYWDIIDLETPDVPETPDNPYYDGNPYVEWEYGNMQYLNMYIDENDHEIFYADFEATDYNEYYDLMFYNGFGDSWWQDLGNVNRLGTYRFVYDRTQDSFEWIPLNVETPDEPYTDTDIDYDDTYTYYFLAPDNYFKSSAGASNSDVGVYWWAPSEPAAWPGVRMTPAFDIGENVFKIEGVSTDTAFIIFNAFVDAGYPEDPYLLAVAHQSVNINTEGYAYGECPYDYNLVTDDFNDWIFVFNCNDKYVNDFSGAETTEGAWFKLDDYKNYGEYYGSYTFNGETPDEPVDTDALVDTDTDTEAPVDTPDAPINTDTDTDEPVEPGDNEYCPDVDGDGEITSIDALMLLRISAGLLTLDNADLLKACDVDGDGVITSIDAVCALRIAAGFEIKIV